MLILALATLFMAPVQAEMVRLDVRPSATAPEIKAADAPHIVLFDGSDANGNLLLWLPGTSGKPHVSPQLNFPQFAAQQGYRVIMLSYITAYSGERDRRFRSIVTAAQRSVLRG